MMPTLCVRLWSVPLPEAMLMSIDLAAPKGHIDVSGLQCPLGPGWCPWSQLPLRALSGSVVLLQLVAMYMVRAVARKCRSP